MHRLKTSHVIVRLLLFAAVCFGAIASHSQVATAINPNQIRWSQGLPSAFATPWGWSPAWQIGGKYMGAFDVYTGGSYQSRIHLQNRIQLSTDIPIDCPSCPGGSLPVIYVEEMTTGGSNVQPNAIAGYVVNGGSQDAVPVSGRVVRAAGATSTTSGLANGSAFYGSAFNLDSLPGATWAGEHVIFNVVTGSHPTDRWNANAPYATGALHLASQSAGSAADCGLCIDALTTPGFHGYWNGILLDANSFEGAEIPGTVGINMGSWTPANHPETGLKFGTAKQHILDTGGPLKINTTGGIQLFGGDVVNPTTNAGMQMYAGKGKASYYDLWADDGTGTGTEILKGNLAWDDALQRVELNTAGNTDTWVNPNGGAVYLPGVRVNQGGYVQANSLVGPGVTVTCADGNGQLVRGCPITVPGSQSSPGHVFGVTYTNTNASALIVSGYATTSGSNTGQVSCQVNGLTVWSQQATATVDGGHAGFFAPVPAGATYVCNSSGGVGAAAVWTETIM